MRCCYELWVKSLKSLKNWCTNIVNEGDRFGYYVNEKKPSLIVKNQTPIEAANDLRKRNKINNATNGKCHLGAAIGSNEFRVEYVTEKVDEWIDELVILSIYAKSQPQAAYAAFCFEEQNKYSYFLRTISAMKELMKPVDESINNELLPSIIGESITN